MKTVVSVGFPIAIPGIYDYRIPDGLAGGIFPGTPVQVNVKGRVVWGVAIELKERSEFPNLKPVLDAKAGQWTDSSQSLIDLYRWIASYYQCDLGKVFKPLVRKKLLQTQAKTVFTYRVTDAEVSGLTAREVAALAAMQRSGPELPTAAALRESCGISSALLASLCKKKALAKETTNIVRDADELLFAQAEEHIILTAEQQAIVDTMKIDLSAPVKPFLLHGITGSGKTYIYIELSKIALQQGRGVIILVPEISLTPQTIRRFKSALGDVVTVMHSRMSEGERRDSLDRLVTGKKRLVVGARSAALVPLDNLGLIIVDEEHDGSYKQTETDPRYNARDVAVMRGRLQKALVVLGSATPSIESYYNAQKGKYHLCVLNTRVGAARLPGVTIVDMNQEHRANNWTFVSRLLNARIAQTLEAGRQVILLFNRRGFSISLICKDCGYVHTCRNCSVTLTYHQSEIALKCHQCGFQTAAPSVCPRCRGDQIKYQGTGIQKAEEYIRRQFPDARLLRMDQDTTRRKGAHVSILEQFLKRQADILLGTQMVAKGLNFPGVALVGVLQADIGLHLPDFRSSEKTFQLLAQVAGRAGREDNCGEVIIQTYSPGEHAVLAAQAHDYAMFYAKEAGDRQSLQYPPFSRLARIIVQATDPQKARDSIDSIALMVSSHAPAVAQLGPSPAILERIKNEFRFSLILKSSGNAALQGILDRIRDHASRMRRSVKVIIDVDPLNML